MLAAGPISDRIGRRPLLKIAAALFAISAIASAAAPDFITLVIARMIGGFGVGAALIIAPMYIAEIAPPKDRGRLVSFNQFNIVIGISAAFFSNYLILKLGQSDLPIVETLKLAEWNWRWMLGVETLPAVVYFLALAAVPESPRWLAMRDRSDEALSILARASDEARAKDDLAAIRKSLESESEGRKTPLGELFSPAMRMVLTIGLTVAILQQITGINSVFFYAPMIFEQSGIGTDASFMQAVLVGIVNLVFTVAAMLLIDRVGRRPLLGFGLAGITICMFTLAYGFAAATYEIDEAALAAFPAEAGIESLVPLSGTVYNSDIEFRTAVLDAIGAELFLQHESQIIRSAISINSHLILIGILGFVASFAISLGPVMWVLFSELFPNEIRGLAISFVGLVNSSVSFLVQFVFPWQLANIGNAATFLIYGVFALLGLATVMRILPETKGRSLEELEGQLLRQ
jgi:MFS family permease